MLGLPAGLIGSILVLVMTNGRGDQGAAFVLLILPAAGSILATLFHLPNIGRKELTSIDDDLGEIVEPNSAKSLTEKLDLLKGLNGEDSQADGEN